MKRIVIMEAIKDMPCPMGMIKEKDQWEYWKPYYADKVCLFRDDFVWIVERPFAHANFILKTYDIDHAGKWHSVDNAKTLLEQIPEEANGKINIPIPKSLEKGKVTFTEEINGENYLNRLKCKFGIKKITVEF
jgi:hypothetical protein